MVSPSPSHPSNVLCHYHMCSGYEGTLADTPEPLPIAYPSSSHQSSLCQSSSLHPSSSGRRQSSQRQSRTARERASAGPSQVSLSAGGQSKWEEPNLPDIPKPHSLFVTAWQEADTSLQRIKSGIMDLGYHFPKPTLLVNVSMLDRKKPYLLNWLSAHLLWISQVDVHLPLKFPSPQMWRDFLNTIDTAPLPLTKSASMKLAMWDILGDAVINLAQGLAEAPQEITWRGMQAPSAILASMSQLLAIAVNAPSSDNQASLCVPGPSGHNDSASAVTSQLPTMVLGVLPSSLGIQVEPGLLGPQPLFVPPH
ncbi:hypothetical protein EDC04DRAFT_2895231 [Pisolithus marmoratus]|nr:hypothetical protein EDC04DRAFT_2895231 [Pisolithus marmoratus]